MLNRRIEAGESILKALKLMDKIDRKLLLVFDKDRFEGVLSIGDIQRAIINNTSLERKISGILRKNFLFVGPEDSEDDVRQKMVHYRTEFMPVVDSTGNLTDVIFWEDLFKERIAKNSKKYNLPVVIMAGGEGTRLRPLTNVLPKPLIPIQNKTILEHIMDSFKEIGCDEFYVSINYKADFIKNYVKNFLLQEYRISFIEEGKPLGTAGSLSLLKGQVHSTFFVSNCDILIDQDFTEILDFHFEQKNELTVVAALKHIYIPYGTIDTAEQGRLIKITEKPEMTIKINSGLYILEPSLLDQIPDNNYYNLTDLITQVISRGGNVGVFPVSENSWTDIGDWKEYLRISQISHNEGTPSR